MASMVFWNCRGAQSAGFYWDMRYLCNHHNCSIISLFETRISGRQADESCALSKGFNNFRVEWHLDFVSAGPCEPSCCWSYLLFCPRAVPCQWKEQSYAGCLWPTFSPEEIAFLDQFGGRDCQYTGTVGDFNYIIHSSERSGGSGDLHPNSDVFLDLINRLGLIDHCFQGAKFTWIRGISSNALVSKRLDWVLINLRGRAAWPDAMVSHLAKFASDHCPLLLRTNRSLGFNLHRRPFRTIFRDVNRRKHELIDRLLSVQQQIYINPSDALLSTERSVKDSLVEVLDHEELLWRQKSWEEWLALWDHNTKFFHLLTLVRRNRNKIERLESLVGTWIGEKTELEEHALNLYRNLYLDQGDALGSLPIRRFPALSEEALSELSELVTDSEIWKAVKAMKALKAPGVDGYQPLFFQDCWPVVSESMIRFLKEFFYSVGASGWG
ncbi:hypothetical protein V2J09_007688 [Rumex salicifolius]